MNNNFKILLNNVFKLQRRKQKDDKEEEEEEEVEAWQEFLSVRVLFISKLRNRVSCSGGCSTRL